MTSHWIVAWIWVVGLGGSLLGCAPPVNPGSGAKEICTLTNQGLNCNVPPDPPDGMLPIEQVPARAVTTAAMATGGSWMGATMSAGKPVLLVLRNEAISKFTFTNGMAAKDGDYLTTDKPKFAALADLDSTPGLDLATFYPTDQLGCTKIDNFSKIHSYAYTSSTYYFHAGSSRSKYMLLISNGAFVPITEGIHAYVHNKQERPFDSFSVANNHKHIVRDSEIDTKELSKIFSVVHDIDNDDQPNAVLIFSAKDGKRKLAQTIPGTVDMKILGEVKSQVTGMDLLSAGTAGDFVVTKDFTNNELIFYPVKKTDSSLGDPMSLSIKLPAGAQGSIVALSFGDFIPKSNQAEAVALFKHEKNIYAALLVFTLSPTLTMTPYLIRGEDKTPLSIPTSSNNPGVLVQAIDLNNDQRDDLILLDQESGTIATLSGLGNPAQ